MSLILNKAFRMIEGRLAMALVSTIMTIIFAGTSFFAIGQNDLLLKKWVVVSSRPISGTGHRVFDGFVLDIKKNTITVSYLLSNASKTIEFTPNRKRIKIDDNFFGKIHFVSKDSLVLDFGDEISTRAMFVPIEKSNVNSDTIDLVKHAWVLNRSHGGDSINNRIDFTSEKWYAADGAYVAMAHFKEPTYKIQQNEKWMLKRIQTEWLLTITHAQMLPIIYRVTNVYDDSIKLHCLTCRPECNFNLYRLKNIGQAQTDSVVSYLSQKHWKSVEILNNLNSSGADTTDSGVFSKGGYLTDTTLIKWNDLIHRRMSFKFGRNFTYQLSVDSTVFHQTNWRLSADGKYIIINDGTHPFDYIEIISMSNGELVIGKCDNFAPDGESIDGYFSCYYEIKLH